MSLHEKGQVVFDVKDVQVSGDRYEGVASVKIIECSPAMSMLLVVPTVAPNMCPPVLYGMFPINGRDELIACQGEYTVRIREFRHGGDLARPPSHDVTIKLGKLLLYWEFMAAYTTAMRNYGRQEDAIDYMVNAVLNAGGDVGGQQGRA